MAAQVTELISRELDPRRKVTSRLVGRKHVPGRSPGATPTKHEGPSILPGPSTTQRNWLRGRLTHVNLQNAGHGRNGGVPTPGFGPGRAFAQTIVRRPRLPVPPRRRPVNNRRQPWQARRRLTRCTTDPAVPRDQGDHQQRWNRRDPSHELDHHDLVAPAGLLRPKPLAGYVGRRRRRGAC